MNRKITISGISILMSLLVLGVGVYAVNLTEATSTANTLASSNPHLQISKNGVDFSDSVSAGLNASHISPGHNQTVTFYMKNTGDQDLNLNVLFNATGVGNALGLTPGHLENDLNVQIACTDTTNVSNTQGAGPAGFSVYESVQSLGATPTNVLAPDDVATCILTASLAVTTDSGQNLVYNATFGGN